jgi:hypothetical protein
MKSKSLLNRFKPYNDYGRSFSTIDPNMSYVIWNFAVTSIFDEFKKKKDVFNESEKKEFEVMVKDLATFKKNMVDFKEPSKIEFEEFLENLFANVDDEDRYGEVTLKTSASFKMIGDLIDILSKWEEIPKEWQQRSKYQ